MAEVAEGETDRPTVIPPFDVSKLAQEGVLSPSALPPPRAPMATISNEFETEQARLRSVLMPSDAPPPAVKGNEGRPAPPVPPAARAPALGAMKVPGLSADEFRIATPAAMRAVQPGSRGDTPTARPSSDEHDFDESPEVEVHETSMPDALDDSVAEIVERYEVGDYEGALRLAEVALVTQPSNGEVLRIAEECQRTLLKLYSARVGPLDRVPFVAVEVTALAERKLDPKSAFLVSLVDGSLSFENVLDASGLPLLEALRVVSELLALRVLDVRPT
jgi:hypothetical protein